MDELVRCVLESIKREEERKYNVSNIARIVISRRNLSLQALPSLLLLLPRLRAAAPIQRLFWAVSCTALFQQMFTNVEEIFI